MGNGLRTLAGGLLKEMGGEIMGHVLELCCVVRQGAM